MKHLADFGRPLGAKDRIRRRRKLITGGLLLGGAGLLLASSRVPLNSVTKKSTMLEHGLTAGGFGLAGAGGYRLLQGNNSRNY
jgi:hypothetical protein